MNTNIFLAKEILKLQKKYDANKKELLRLFELVTYLAATKQISLQDATYYTDILINIKER